MSKLLLNAQIVNEGIVFHGHLFIQNQVIKKILSTTDDYSLLISEHTEIIDLSGYYVLPGLIDIHVHFREPGLTHKGTIFSESRAAVAGGVTSALDMPNTNPPTLTEKLLDEKLTIAAKNSFVNYGFFIGVSSNNLDDVLNVDPRKTCGIKLFLGSSTGNMLVEDEQILNTLFAEARLPIVVHAEDEKRICENTERIKSQYGENPPISVHPIIRDVEACYQSTKKAVELAQKYNTKLHVAHLSTAKELNLFSDTPLSEKRITSEVCVQHLWFAEDDYERLGTKIKCNPAIKSFADREALREAVNSGLIDVIATDHAPHTRDEKAQPYFKAPSGIPLVQHSLQALLDLVHQGIFSLETIVQKTAHNPATLFGFEKRGFIREGYFADLAVVDMNISQTIDSTNILYKCGWSPFEEFTFKSKIICTFVNGNLVFQNFTTPQFKHSTTYQL
ncbi:MAG: dihydroorotase [Bacteroidales bacterium]|jgi:dihydroorotase|nr:dihydroorotase [Bacteroidales bacterium]